jgi:Holliday junction resolvase RusA-like endonuclease
MPDLNDLLSASKRHPMAGNKMKRDYATVANACIRQARRRTPLRTPVYIVYRFYEADKRRDKSNVAAFAIKVIEDSLQEVGLLPNDGWAEVENWTCGFGIDKDNPRIEVTVYEQGEY